MKEGIIKNIHGGVIISIILCLLYFNQLSFKKDVLKLVLILVIIFIIRQLIIYFVRIIKKTNYKNHMLYSIGFYSHPLTGILPFYEKIWDKQIELNSKGYKRIKSNRFVNDYLIQPIYQLLIIVPNGGAYTLQGRTKEELLFIRSVGLITGGIIVLVEIERMMSIGVVISIVYIYVAIIKPGLGKKKLIEYEKFTYKRFIDNRLNYSLIMIHFKDYKREGLSYYGHTGLKNKCQYYKWEGPSKSFLPEDTYFYSENLLEALDYIVYNSGVMNLEDIYQIKWGLKNRERIKGTKEDICGTPGDMPKEAEIEQMQKDIKLLEINVKYKLEGVLNLIYRVRVEGLGYDGNNIESAKEIRFNYYIDESMKNKNIKRENKLNIEQAKQLYNELWNEIEKDYGDMDLEKEKGTEFGKAYGRLDDFTFGGGGFEVEKEFKDQVFEYYKEIFKQLKNEKKN